MEEPKLHVGILSAQQIDFVLLTPYRINGEVFSESQSVQYKSGKIQWKNQLYDELLFEPIDQYTDSFELKDVVIGINFHWERKEDQRFLGALKFIVMNEQVTAINIIRVEDYLTSVISSEMSATASLELLKAHAVISRSWSLSPALSKGEGEGENTIQTPSSTDKEAPPQTENSLSFGEGRGEARQHYHTANCTNYNCLKENQKKLKSQPTEAERIVWEHIRNNQLGTKFRRQHIINDYIVDFVCLPKKLIIEIDGEYHNDPQQIEKDNTRTNKLSEQGYKIIRFTNNEVITNINHIKQTISDSLSFGEGRGEAIRWYDREDHTRFDVCADDHCQRYQGITRASTPIVKEAIDATRGQILMSEGAICDARFSKCCGGAFEEFQYCWEETKFPYLLKQRDSKTDMTLPDLRMEPEAEKWIRTSPEAFCNTSDKKILEQVLNNYDQETTHFYRWKVEYTQEELSQLILQRSGIDYGQIIDLIPIERGTSARLTKLKIIGTKLTMTIGKELEIRRTLSTSHLYSSAFVVDKAEVNDGIPGKFVLTGAGWGHGVGLCQIGAAVMGEQGYSYEDILLHYYIGASIDKLY